MGGPLLGMHALNHRHFLGTLLEVVIAMLQISQAVLEGISRR
jgi:hypothetical protein